MPPDDDHDQPRPRPRGRTVIASLLVFAFLFIIAGMLLPIQWTTDHGSRKTSCGNNQRQIILSSLVYGNDNDQFWPIRPTDAHGRPTTNPAAIDGFCTAAASFELLMVRNTDLPVKIFMCPSNTGTLQFLSSPYANAMSYATGQSQWGNNHQPATPGGPGAMPYTYDWSAPTTTDACRIMMTDRGNLTVAHKSAIMAAAADGHVVTIRITAEDAHRTPTTPATLDLNGNPEIASFAANDSSRVGNPDDVYDAVGDGTFMYLPAQGSATRSWVR